MCELFCHGRIVGDMRSQHVKALVAALACILASAAWVGAEEAWWSPAWTHRRAVTVPPFKPTGLKTGEDVAEVSMYTGGQVASDGSDVRVTTSEGAVVRHRVLMIGPGDQMRLAFALRPGVTKYFVYFGSTKGAANKDKELEIQRGVLQESWEHEGTGAIKTFEQVQKIFNGSTRLVGREFRGRIFNGHNPFGPQNKLATIYTGWVICPSDGEYTFCTSSQDASFLMVDDKMVVENGGHHLPQNDVRVQATTKLTAGMHKLTMYHVNITLEPTVVAAWALPGRKEITPIPADFFAPVEHGTAGILEKYGQPVNIDYTVEHVGEQFLHDAYYQRYVFTAVSSGQVKGALNFAWEFGDGQKAVGPKVEHVYLHNGPYTVTLASKTGFGDLKRSNQVFVGRPWATITQNKLDTLKQQAEIVAGYDFQTLESSHIPPAVLILKRAGMTDALIHAGMAFVARDKATAEQVDAVLPSYVDALITKGKPDVAVDALQKAAKMTSNPAVAADMLTRAGKISLEYKNDNRLAMELYQRVVKQYAALTTNKAIRDARIGIGDVYRSRADYEQAYKAYEAAKIRSEDVIKRAAILRGDFARQAEDYIRRKDFESAKEALDRWEDTFPVDKLEGYWSLLEVKFLLAQGSYDPAIREVDGLVSVNPTSNYAPELLMLAVEAYQKLGQADKARTVLRRINEKYPESKLSAEAGKKLKDK